MSAPLEPRALNKEFESPSEEGTRLASLLSRPLQQRVLEFKYRFAQAVIFGLPVLGLQYFGHSLGGSTAEASRWVGLLQALLAGWVTYVAAAGMAVEALILLPKRFTWDLLVALPAIVLCLYSIISVAGVFFHGRPFYEPLLFHWDVMLLQIGCGLRWLQLRRMSP